MNVRTLLAVAALAASPVLAHAATVTVNPNGTLTASSSTASTDNSLVTPAGLTSGFNFSGATGSFLGTISTNGYYYADYLVDVTSSTAESVTTSLTNTSGVTNLSERIYGYTGSFLGDASAGAGITQIWSTNLSLPGASISIISPTNLVTGQYVVELRGQTVGNFAGTLSITPVPEPTESALLLTGLAALAGVAVRRRRKA